MKIESFVIIAFLTFATAANYGNVKYCKKGLFKCSNKCVSLKSDKNNCGKCKRKCGSDKVCKKGKCLCGPNLKSCYNKCVNVLADKNNCGQCGKKCTGSNLCVSGVCACSPSFVSAVNVDFENPPYSPPGPINGIDQWTSTGAVGPGFGCAVYDQKLHALTSSQLTSFPTFGAQSFRISNAVTSGCFGDQSYAKPLQNVAGETGAAAGAYSVGIMQRYFETEFDIASADPANVQTNLRISVSPDRGDGARMSYLRFEDSANGINVFFDDVQGTLTATDSQATSPCSWRPAVYPPGAKCANFVETQVGTNLDRTKPHKIKFAIKVIDGASNDEVKVYIDGNLVITGTTWEDYYRFDGEANQATSSDPHGTTRIIRTVLFRSSGTAITGNLGKGFLIDNLKISSGKGCY